MKILFSLAVLFPLLAVASGATFSPPRESGIETITQETHLPLPTPQTPHYIVQEGDRLPDIIQELGYPPHESLQSVDVEVQEGDIVWFDSNENLRITDDRTPFLENKEGFEYDASNRSIDRSSDVRSEERSLSPHSSQSLPSLQNGVVYEDPFPWWIIVIFVLIMGGILGGILSRKKEKN